MTIGPAPATATRPKIAIFSGPTAMIANSQPLVTSNKAREKYGLPPAAEPGRQPDALRRATPAAAGGARHGLRPAVQRPPAGAGRGRAVRAAGRLRGCPGRVPPPAPEPDRRAGLRSRAAARGRSVPATTSGVARSDGRIVPVPVTVRDASGDLLPTAIPRVSLVKDAQQFGGDAALDDPGSGHPFGKTVR